MCNRSLPSIFDPPENLFQKTAKKKSKKSKESTERIDSNPTSNPISFHHPPESTPQPVDKSPKSAASIRASTGLRRPSAGASPGLRPSVRPGFTRAPSIRPSGLHPGSVRPSAGASPGLRPSVRRGFTRVSGVRPLRLAGGNQNRPWGWT